RLRLHAGLPGGAPHARRQGHRDLRRYQRDPAHRARARTPEGELMDIFKTMVELDHEQLVFCHEPSVGYRGLIAIHNTALRPALRGTRYWQYATEQDAVTDALRLARGMTYKAAVAGLNLGGGKSVILSDPKVTDREAIFRAHGRFVEMLKGRYITAEDVGTSP